MENLEKEIDRLQEEVEYWKGKFAESYVMAMEEHEKYAGYVRNIAIQNKNLTGNDPAVLQSKLARAYAEKNRLEIKLSRFQRNYSPGEMYRLEAALIELAREKEKNSRLQREIGYLRTKENEQAVSQSKQADCRSTGKPAYKKEITPREIGQMLERGMNVSQIAEKLGISRNTVYARIKELGDKNGN